MAKQTPAGSPAAHPWYNRIMSKIMKSARLRARYALLALLPITTALAQEPPKLEPLPEVPPPPRMQIDPNLEPSVTISKRGEDKVEEFRVKGKLYMIRV